MPRPHRSLLPRRLVLPLSAVALVAGILTATGVAAEQYGVDHLDGYATNFERDTGEQIGETYRITPDDDFAAPPTAPVVVAISPAPVPQSVSAMIVDAAGRHGANAQQMLRVAKCESNYNPAAKGDYNRAGVPQSLGVFQIQAAIFSITPQAGGNRLDAYTNIEAAAWLFSRGHANAWTCR